MSVLSIVRRELIRQPVLFVRARIARHELAQAIALGVGAVYAHALRSNVALLGQPFTRYAAVGPGLMTIEIGFAVPASAVDSQAVMLGELPGGPAAVAVHAGPYEQLPDTYSAIERWIEENGLQTAGAPWESYLTDPTDYPDPADWRTEVTWPVIAL